jgi:hypothetical protein
LELRGRELAYPASFGRLVADTRSNPRPRLWIHRFRVIQLCRLLRERIRTSDVWRSRRSSS